MDDYNSYPSWNIQLLDIKYLKHNTYLCLYTLREPQELYFTDITLHL